jgi:heme/copper-type cytochrome/quinol oxidase subunit 2
MWTSFGTKVAILLKRIFSFTPFFFFKLKYVSKADERSKYLTFTFWWRRFVKLIKFIILSIRKFSAYCKKVLHKIKIESQKKGIVWQWYLVYGYVVVLFIWVIETAVEWYLEAPFGTFLLHFSDAVTVYSFGLLGLHGFVMWYIFFVLGVVCWSIFSIVYDYAWRKPSLESKLPGAYLAYNSSNIFVFVKSLIYFFFFKIIYFNINFLNYIGKRSFDEADAYLTYRFWVIDQIIFDKILDYENSEDLAKFVVYHEENKDFSTQAGLFFTAAFFIGTKLYLNSYDHKFSILRNLSFKDVYAMGLKKKRSLQFFSISSKAEFYNDDFSQMLKALSFKHSSLLELIWAGFPIVIIGLILLPSLILLYSLDEELDPYLTVKVIGHQWYWSYEIDTSITSKVRSVFDFFDDATLNSLAIHFSTIKGSFYGDELNSHFFNEDTFKTFVDFSREKSRNAVSKPCFRTIFVHSSWDSYLVTESDLNKGSRRLLETDKHLILPANVVIRFLVTSGDVLHAWTLPEAGIKVDAVPGRLNQMVTWFVSPGSFYGQCSELCGVGHGFMPIVVDVFLLDDWVEQLISSSDTEIISTNDFCENDNDTN